MDTRPSPSTSPKEVKTVVEVIFDYAAWLLPVKFLLAIVVTMLAKTSLAKSYRRAAYTESKLREVSADDATLQLEGRAVSRLHLAGLAAIVAGSWLSAFWGFGYEFQRGGVLGVLSILSSLLLLALLGVVLEYNIRTQDGGTATASRSASVAAAESAVRTEPVEVLNLAGYITSQLSRPR